jgi:hypothetical protein
MRTSFNFSQPFIAIILSAAVSACGGGGADTRVDATMSSSASQSATTLAAGVVDSGSTTWKPCATEGGTCDFSGTAQVRYGTETQYFTKSLTGPVTCSNEVFGDPALGTVKSCSIASLVDAVPAPARTTCAAEGDICNISGTAEVRYGTATQFVTKTVTGPVSCSNEVFGDPALGSVKSCSIVAPGAMPPPLASIPATPAAPAPATPTVPAAPTGPVLPAAPPVAGAITDVRLENVATVAQNNVPITFGQVFSKGHLQPTDKLTGHLEDGTSVPLQVDVKATHADGSVRHAIISAVLPSVAPSKVSTMSLLKGGATTTSAAAVDSLTSTGFNASVHAKIGGVDYYASADELLKNGKASTWLSGPIATEWLVSAPLQTTSGVQHPHLSARFAVRWYPGAAKARVDVTVENDWAYEPSPQNFTYDASVIVGGQAVYSKAGLTHLHHARWRKLFWFNGSEPKVSIKHNTAYLIATGAVPNYDQSIVVPEDAIVAFQNQWNSSSKEPMGTGFITPYMPTTGGRNDIGLLPAWSATYLLSQDSRMKEFMLRTADLAGSFSAHFRDKQTGRPVSLMDHPFMTVNGRAGDTFNPATKQFESFPNCAGAGLCDTPYTHDAPHQPALVYLPYLVTGDYYYLEELQFWGMWNAFETNPGYRDNIKGIVSSEQVRGQAWSLRTLAEAAYITPDADSLKAGFVSIINNNLDWYSNTYVTNSANTQYANKLGIVVNGFAIEYDNGIGIAPWQDDFFTSAIGHAAELGFTKADSLLAWKAQFPINRMVGAGACWIDAAMYGMHVRATSSSPFYTTIGEAFKNSHDAAFNGLECGSAAMATLLKLKVGEMTGYSTSVAGYPSNMQPALAYAATVGGDQGKKAWALFAARSVKPDYRYAPQFAIVPR